MVIFKKLKTKIFHFEKRMKYFYLNIEIKNDNNKKI